MQLSSRAKLTLEERTYRALGEIAQKAAKTEDGEPTEEILLDAIVNWTTDAVHREGNHIIREGDIDPDEPINLDELDLPHLFNYVVLHINAQQSAQAQISMARAVISDLDGIDTDKLGAQDPEEWDKMLGLLRERMAAEENGEFPSLDFPEGEYDLDSLLAQAGEAPKEGTADEVVQGALLDRVDQQIEASMIIAEYLTAIKDGNMGKAHAFIDHYGCGLTHALTSLLMTWVGSRQVLPEALEFSDWIDSIRDMAEHTKDLSPEEKLDLARHFMEHDDDDDELGF